MHQVTTPREEQRLLRTVPATGDADLLAEVVELRAKNEQLARALASRAVIDQARGMVMALAPCSSERAWDVLVEVSQHCNIKLRDVAAALVVTTNDRTLPEPVQRELRRALRGLHLADRTSTEVATRHRRDPP
ncbi:AmiR/NasT family two-component response regulator [Streptomyces sp. V4I2]|nr:AmiR/NasT family two-component response regulator [Streptomyces sp. V4I2]